MFHSIQPDLPQANSLNKIIPNCSIAMTKNKVDTDPSLWKRAFKDGEFRIVYASPEILFIESLYFLKNVLPDANHPFKKNWLLSHLMNATASRTGKNFGRTIK